MVLLNFSFQMCSLFCFSPVASLAVGAPHAHEQINMLMRRLKGRDKAWRSPTLSMLRPQPRSFYLRGRLGHEHVVVELDCKLLNLAGDLQRGGLSPSNAVLTLH